jgi:Holliday junction DNA helicase RuvA
MLVGLGDRGASGVVGYVVSVPHHSRYGAFLPGEKIELFIHTHVREDSFDLYGFSSHAEKALFLTLLNVNGIGPKSALGILGAVEWDQLIEAIMEEDQAFLTRIPGIGKKTAERMVVELRDSVKKKVDQGAFVLSSVASGGAGASTAGSERPKPGDSAVIRDAKSALMGLGYREQDVQQLLARATKDSKFTKTEDLIKTVLRQLAL